MSNKKKSQTSSIFSTEVTTTISISLVLFLLGLTFFVIITGREISTFIKENLSITIELSDVDTSQKGAIANLQKRLKESSYVKSVTYISKEDVRKDLIEELGADPEEILGYTPASSYFDIKLKSDYANPDSIKTIENNIKQEKVVKNFIYNQDTLHVITSNLSKLGIGFTILAILLLIISYTLIRNTIQLNIYSKRFLINTMQLVGATDGFIRRPFVVRAIIAGIIAALIANIGITTLVYALIKEFPEIVLIVNQNNLLLIYGVVLILGVVLTYLITRFAVNKYLKMETNNLYYV